MVIFRQVQNENGNNRSYRNSYRECKKKEFLEHGFQNANLRRISSESGGKYRGLYIHALGTRLDFFRRW